MCMLRLRRACFIFANLYVFIVIVFVLFSFAIVRFRFAGAWIIFANLYGVRKLVLMILASGLNNMLSLPAWYGLFDHTAARACGLYRAHKMARRGVDWDSQPLVWGCAGERLIPFPVFSVLSGHSVCVLFLAGVRTQRRMAVSNAAGPSTGL